VYKLAEDSPISPHVIKIMGYIEILTKLGCEIKDDLATDVILHSLSVSYESFIMNFIKLVHNLVLKPCYLFLVVDHIC
jgi:hypothetical protein